MDLAFWLTTLVVVATPGTGAVYTVSMGLGQGRRASLVAAVGCTLGVLPHLLAAITGLAALLHASALAFQTLKYAGVAYLVFLAWQTWRDRTPLVADDSAETRTARSIVREAVLINLLNPKLTIFFFAFLPLFVQPGAGEGWVQMTVLGLVFMAVTLLVFAGYGVLAAAVRSHVLQRPSVVAWLRRTFAATYLVLAGRLALPER
ncbi:MAG: LysE family translocator [Propionibacteriaceae bacterium]|nr:LysE family translocator [Propionibacteriaceae bacterium]